jgi:hypothetical protein
MLSWDTAEALMSRSESPVAPGATAAGGLPAMRREIARRGAGRRSVWAEAALGFEEGRELEVAGWRRKRRPSAVGAAAAAISGER